MQVEHDNSVQAGGRPVLDLSRPWNTVWLEAAEEDDQAWDDVFTDPCDDEASEEYKRKARRQRIFRKAAEAVQRKSQM